MSKPVKDLVAALEASLAEAKAKQAERHATVLRDEVRRLLGESAPEVPDDVFHALAEQYPQQPRMICQALRRLWEMP